MDELLLEKAASQFRSDYGLNNKDAIRLKSLLQKLNVITVFKPLGDGFSGMAIKTTAGGSESRFMLVNSAQSLGKQHFTICHELYHLYIQKSFTSRVCNTGQFNKAIDKEEYNADVFASYLLLPTDGLLELIPDEELGSRAKVTLKTVVFLEQFYSCSRKALLYRLKKMKLISSQQYDEFAVNVKRTATEYGHTTELYEAGNDQATVGDYGSRAKELFDQEKISESHYYSLLFDLGIDVSILQNSVDADEGAADHFD